MHVALEYLKLKPYALLSFDNSRVSVPKYSNLRQNFLFDHFYAVFDNIVPQLRTAQF